MRKHNLFKRLISAVICLALVLASMPASLLSVAANDSNLTVLSDSKKADPSTMDGWKAYFGPDKKDTEFAGAVWTDKSVFSAANADLPGVALTDSNNFLVSLSAIASNMSITGHTSAPTDTMLVLDMSGSMVDDTYEVGTVRQGNRYQTVNGIDMSLIEAMVDATNATIDKLMKQNSNNRVGVVLYSGNASTSDAATPATATVILPLGRYTGIGGEYLSVDTTWQTANLYRYVSSWFGNGYWEATGETATYVPSGTAVNVSVKNGLKTEGGADVDDQSKRANGGTYIQNGLYQAMNQFLDPSIDTVVPAGKPQAGAERMPVIVLMTDGAPTVATASYNNIGNSHIGDGTTTTDRITFMTQLTAAYVRGRVATKYQENANDEKEMLFLTLGLGTENSSAATNTLYPAGSSSTLTGYWNSFLAGTAGSNVQIVSGGGGWSVYRDAAVEAMNYVDKYFYASNAQGLLDSFNQILSEIQLKADSYTTLVEDSGADFSGYVTFEDELGEMMQVDAVKGIFMDDGNGNKVLYTGKGVAEGMTNGNLGTVDGPTERGNELVRTVKERIPGTTTTQAQQLIDNAYNDQQLYHTDDANWSNYIGWYADANGNYAGFWDKDSGYENAPAGAVYANRSYGYLGVNGDSDMMHVVVMVRTDLRTLHQTVVFKIPASLLPTVRYSVTLAEDDPTAVETFEQETAIPMQLVFEVGLREDINSVNLEQKIAEHIAKGGHVHRNQDGTVTFYTNEWAIGNDSNGNGIPDPEEVDTAIVTQSHFHPALDNSRFYYTDDTVILTGNGSTVTGGTRPSGSGYYYERYIYSENGRQVINTPIAETTLANDAEYDTHNGYWYIPAGTMYRNFARFKTVKTGNPTGTLDYSFFPAVFDSVSKQDVYMFLGNNGAFTVAPATGFTLNKQVDGIIEDAQSYTFQVTLSNIPGGTAAPVLTDANGTPMAGMSAYENNQFTLTLPAGVTAYISGIPVGTNVQIAEQIGGDYHISKILTAGEDQTAGGIAAFTVPGYTANGNQMVPVEFTNAPNQYGDLVILKDVHHSLESDPEALASKIFSFKVSLTGSSITTGDTFDTSAGKKVIVGQDGVLSFEDGTAISLHNDESLTVYRLPAGTHYTVEETDIPDGFTLTSVNDAAATSAGGQIEGGKTQQAGFINTYPDEYVPVSLDLNLTINKILNGNPPTPETFEFALQQLLSDNTSPDIKVFTISSDAANKVATDTLELNFDYVGTYFYRIVEKAPASPTAGMTYSTTRALFAVIVTDNDMDGKLEIAVREEANIDASVIYSDPQDSETATSITVGAEFTNTYEVHSTNVTVDVHKNLVNNTGVDIPLTAFRFGIYEVDAQGEATGDPIQTATASALGEATFSLLITEDKDLTYIIKEIVPTPARVGMTYSPAQYILSIAVEAAADGQLSATTSIVRKGAEDQGEAAPVFENTYELTAASATIPLSKTLTGRAPKANETFSFYLVRTDDTYKPLTGSNAYDATYNFGIGNASISLSGLNKAGTYHYKLTEIAGSEGGMVYDPAEYHITITVTDNQNGALVASAPVIHKVGQADAVNTAAFVNTYTVTGTGDVTIGGEKELSGRAMVAGEFTMGLYSDAACTDELATAANRADGTFSFPTIHYTVADLGADYAHTVYTYYVKEIVPDDAVLNASTGKYEKNGVTYDDTVHTVTVTVSHADGKLTVTPSDNAATLTVNNSYYAKPTGITLSGRKDLNGDWSAVSDANKTFTFHLYQTGADFAVAAGQAPISYRSVTGSGSFSMSLGYEDGQEGFHYYVLKEVIPAQRAGGVSYDAGAYHITVNVSDPGNGQLIATRTVYRPGTGNVNTSVFANAYTVEPATVLLSTHKSFLNSINNAPLNMQDNDFTFVILEVDDPAQTDLSNAKLVSVGYNLADGTVPFPAIEYTVAGVHHYKILELPGQIGYIDYDDTVMDVTVTVTDNGAGKLIPTVTTSCSGAVITADAENKGAVTVSGLTFRNTYIPGAAQVKIQGIKTFDGDWSKVPAANKEFTFALYPADEQFNITGPAIEETSNIGTAFEFTTLSYSAEDTCYYVIKEIAGAQNVGITYSGAEIHITVDVNDNGSGKLIPTVTTDFSGASITADQTDAGIVTVSALEFVNTYEAEPISKVLTATKEYDGKNMLNFVFTLEGADSTGNIRDRKSVDTATKTVTFDALNFNSAGTYTFTVEEAQTILGGFIKWDTTEYTVTILVIDNGTGKLEIESISYADENGDPANNLAFHNGYQMEDNELVLSVRKTMTGDATTPRDFTFGLYTDLNAAPVDTVTIPAIDKTAAKEASFQKLIYNQADVATGTFTYYIKELRPMDGTQELSFKDGITYDTTVYTVVVTLTDNEDGTIGISYTVNGNDVDETTYKFAFENKYEYRPTSYTVIAQKDYKGDDMKAFTFVLEGNGFATQTKQNTVPAGVVTFDELVFTAPGTYTFRLSEQAEVLWDFIKWDVNRYTIEIQVVDNEKGELTIPVNGVTITSTLGRDDLLFRNVHEDEILKKDVFLENDRSVSIDGKKVQPGDILTYTLTYTNYTGLAVDEVVISDTIPNHTVLVDGSVSNSGAFDGSKLTWKFQNVPADDVITVSFQVKVVDAGVTVENKGAVLEGTNTYHSVEVKNPVDKIEKEVSHISDTSLNIDGKEVELNDILLYKITYTNADDAPAQVTITDTIPRYTSYVDGSATEGGSLRGDKLVWELQLAAGESKTVSFQVKVTETKVTIENQAFGETAGNRYETKVVKNPVDEDIVVKDAYADADLTIKIDGKKVEKGDILYYAITYTNADDIAGTVTITDAIPGHTTYVEGSADNGGTYAGGKLTWVLQLAAGESRTVSFQVKVADAGAEISNQAQAVEGENILYTNIVKTTASTDTVKKDVFNAAAPTVSIDGKEVKNGSILLYKITYKNNDDAPAQVTITDTIPSHTTYVEGSADNGGAYAGGKLTWGLQLAAGEEKTVSFQVKVNGDGVRIVNTATAVEGGNTLQTNQVSNTTPAPTPSDNPNTGDNTPVTLLATAMLFSFACLFVLVLSRKKKTN